MEEIAGVLVGAGEAEGLDDMELLVLLIVVVRAAELYVNDRAFAVVRIGRNSEVGIV
jgi:hypothetical protein